MENSIAENDSLFIKFVNKIDHIVLPEKFTFPFYYEPHPICLLAAQELQARISIQFDDSRGFGEGDTMHGKMFGVLVVENDKKEIGYLAAFSGKINGNNLHPGFCPPVFNILVEDGFYRKGELEIMAVTQQIENIENSNEFIKIQSDLNAALTSSANEIDNYKIYLKEGKKNRDLQRENIQNLNQEEQATFEALLKKESIEQNYGLKHLTKDWKTKIENLTLAVEKYKEQIEALKVQRRKMSGQLQATIFENFVFLNYLGEKKDLNKIFEITDEVTPPSGAGECAAPKFFQYAFQNNYRPIAMAEFWWGPSPMSEIRKHGYYYPACKSKCEPILNHMLEGLELDENPLLINPAFGKELPIIFEDEAIIIVNKPAEFLSVPGRKIDDSVYTRILAIYPDTTSPLIVHRLDMSTSGLLILAKTKEAHEHLQRQFIKRTIKKRYVALLDGILENDEGLIDLPIRLDVENRPFQLVDFKHGKTARTKYEVVKRQNGKTKVYFYPITGRTHQLRVHASHPLGLNTPIVGDDLYGLRADRLYLHAQMLEFKHPTSKQIMKIEVNEDW